MNTVPMRPGQIGNTNISQASLSRLNIRAETGHGVRDAVKYFMSSKILSSLGTVANQEIAGRKQDHAVYRFT